ncbi:FAS1 domain-containing protein [Cystobasidium minutum MCA 4210]|uniref:FAS1 domain-containing protein n=1 Tax=Cystobasidium minutum MCA 4210 TaxID=1397322 RepID=UPI0034CF462C|eukprot:jgi/Rhomi1/178126/fgenesh1_pg.2_\
MKYSTASISLASLAAVALAQDSSSSMMMSGSGSMSMSGSSSAAAATSTGMSGSGNSTYASGLVAALQAANLTTLASVLGGFPDLATQLEMGGNATVFAPNNAALSPLLADPSSVNQTMIAEILSYHISPMTLPVSALGMGMNHTIAPSMLMEPLLGMNQIAPLVLSIGMDGQPRVRTAAQNVTVLGNTTYQNLLVHVVNEVIMPPMNLTSTLSGANLTALTGALSMVSEELPMALSNTPRLTVFAPADSAFANISSTLQTLNQSTIMTVLANHIINGTVVYSTAIMNDTTAISAAGETFTFAMNNGTLTVMSGEMAMARVIRSDIPITNGVVHIIDQVLANTMSNTEAAASAASSYAAAATASPSGVAPAGSNGNGNTGAATKSAVVGFSLVAALFGGFAILA